MQAQYPLSEENLQASASMARQLAEELEAFLAALLMWLDAYVDKR